MDSKIEEVEQAIAHAEEELTNAVQLDDIAYWRKKEEQLRKEEEQLRKKEEQLRKKEEQEREERLLLRKEEQEERLLLLRKEEQEREEKLLLLKANAPEGTSHSKRSRPQADARPHMQSFVESAARHYRQWEQAQEAGVENGGHKNFLVVSSDPFLNYPAGFVVWIRKCYRDLKEILMKANDGERFLLLGTAGIGKSLFTLFWICYRATLKEKVAWKLWDEWYLLDFSKEGSPSLQVVLKRDSELQEVLKDPNAWLIIDGEQPRGLNYRCHILVACSFKKKNYHEFMKNRMVSTRYVPVWSKEELNEFLDDFEALKVNYSHMGVPTKVEAIEAFGKLGGVPRYVLSAKGPAEGIRRANNAVTHIEKTACLKLFSGTLEELEMSDSLVHIKCRDESYGGSSMFYDFASPYVQDAFGQRFTKLSEDDVVDFLRNYAYKDAGSIYGYIFELVAHQLMQRGGDFPMKRVGSNGVAIPAEAETTLPLPGGMRVVEFAEVKELASMSPNTYYKPLSPNFESVDAVIYPNILLQFFSSRRGIHGYKVNGLKALHGQLKQIAYKLCSCVPEDKYQITGFQNRLKADKTKYSKPDTTLELMDQYVVQVDYKKYNS